jgi:hypothetical protein
MQNQSETSQETGKPDFEAIVADLKAYVDTSVDLYKLKATEKAALLASDLAIIAVVVFFVLLMVVFGSLALAIVLTKMTGKLYIGYLIVSGMYLVLVVAIYFSRNRWLKSKLADTIIKSLHAK